MFIDLPAWLRVPLWSLAFPLVLYPWHALKLACLGRPGIARLCTRDHWVLTWRIYLIGLDGR